MVVGTRAITQLVGLLPCTQPTQVRSLMSHMSSKPVGVIFECRIIPEHHWACPPTKKDTVRSNQGSPRVLGAERSVGRGFLYPQFSSPLSTLKSFYMNVFSTMLNQPKMCEEWQQRVRDYQAPIS